MFQDPTFWVAIAFVVFVIAVFRPIRKALTGALDKRADNIRQELDDAQALREEAQKTLAEYKRLQRDAVSEAADIIEKAKHEAEAEAQRTAQKQLEVRRAEIEATGGGGGG